MLMLCSNKFPNENHLTSDNLPKTLLIERDGKALQTLCPLVKLWIMRGQEEESHTSIIEWNECTTIPFPS